jgi:hypothetical protein
VPTICLKLEREGSQEITDSNLTMNQLAILAGETLQVRVQREAADDQEVTILDTDEEEGGQHASTSQQTQQQQKRRKKKARVEEKGFQGTLLGRSMTDSAHSHGLPGASATATATSHTSSSPTPDTAMAAPSMPDLEVACKACTFLNPIDGNAQCAMCGSDL